MSKKTKLFSVWRFPDCGICVKILWWSIFVWWNDAGWPCGLGLAVRKSLREDWWRISHSIALHNGRFRINGKTIGKSSTTEEGL